MPRMPYTNFHDINLDWVIKQIKKAFTPDNPPPYPVKSVNGLTGDVTVTGDIIPVRPGGVDVQTALNEKQTAPNSPGTPGKVLGLDQNQTPVWLNQPNPESIIDDNAGGGDTDKVYSADHVLGLISPIIDEVGDINLIVNKISYDYEIKLPRSFFIRKATLNSSGAATDNDARAVTFGRVSIPFPCKIVVENNSNVQFALFNTITNTSGGWVSEQYVNGLENIRIIVRTVDNAEISGTDIDAVHIYSTYVAKDAYESIFVNKFTRTTRLPEYDAVDSKITRYRVDTSTNNVGTLLRNNTSCRATYAWQVCEESDCIIWCGQYSTSYIDIIINNAVVATLNRGECYKITKGTKFLIGFVSTSATSTITNACFVVVPETTPSESNYQLLDATVNSGQDCCFVIGDKVFAIGRETTGYSVKQGDTWLVTKAALGIDVGHANSCNYDSGNGKAYVSDWRDHPESIYVFSVDAQNNSMTYEKTITVPLPADRGSTEYYVFDNEKQIIYLSWESGNSSTNPNTLMFGLYVLTSTGYVLSWEKKAARGETVQGMTVQDNYIYYVEVTGAAYDTYAINRINMATGEVEYADTDVVGSIASNESEGIASIGKQTFIVLTRNGNTYLVTFRKKQSYSNL